MLATISASPGLPVARRARSAHDSPRRTWPTRRRGGSTERASDGRTFICARIADIGLLRAFSPGVNARNSPMSAILAQMNVRPSEARSVEPPRLRVGQVRRGESWADLARRATGNPGDAEIVANINGFDLRTAPETGMMVKLPEEVVRDDR